MIRNANNIHKNIYVSIIMLLAIFIQIFVLTNEITYYTVFIPAGFAAGFYISFGNKVLPGIMISSILGVFLFSFLFNGKGLYVSAFYTISVFSVNIVVSLIMNLLLTKLNCKRPDTLNKAVYFFVSVIIATTAVSIFPALQYSFSNNTAFIHEFQKIYEPIFVGIIIFTTTIILSNHYDEEVTLQIFKKYKQILFIIFFFFTTYLIFSDYVEIINFATFGILFIILFMINSFIFNYRMLIFNSLMFIIIYSDLYLKFIHPDEALKVSTQLDAYLLILLIITIFTKIQISEIHEKNKELLETKEKFSGMLDSTLNLLSIGNTLNFKNEAYKETYIKSIFDIAMKIFPEITHGSCGIIGDNGVVTLNTKGYEFDSFKTLKFPINYRTLDTYTPILNTNFPNIFENAFGEDYEYIKNILPQLKQSLVIIIRLSKESKGVIFFDILADSKEEFTKTDINNIAAFQKMINSFYETHELSLKNTNLKDDIVLSLIRTLELYDPYTGGHSEDVATLSKFIAEKMNLSNEDTYNVYWAGIVHDIGKIGISSDIINKAGKLTLEEYKEIQKHPIYGFDILNRSLELKTIAKLVKHHHEWYNGSGYPSGLKDDQIPFGAQILQVADSVSSMASSRIYQKSKTFSQIITELELYKGTQFNPIICDHMIELIQSGVIEDYFKFNKYHSNE